MTFETSLDALLVLCAIALVLQAIMALGVMRHGAGAVRGWMLAAYAAFGIGAAVPLLSPVIPFTLSVMAVIAGALAGLAASFLAVATATGAPAGLARRIGAAVAALLAMQLVVVLTTEELFAKMVSSSLINGTGALLAVLWILRGPARRDLIAGLFLAVPFALAGIAYLGRLVAYAVTPGFETYLASTALIAIAITVALFNLLFALVHWEARRLSERIEAAHRESERASAAKTAFLRGLSHELRTPMTAILGFSELLQRAPEDALAPPLRRNVGRIHEAGRHLLGLIDELLDLAMIEGGQLELDEETFAPRDLVDAATGMAASLAAARGVTVDANPAPAGTARRAALAATLPPGGTGLLDPAAGDRAMAPDRAIIGDRRRLTQALINILANAVKFAPEGGRVAIRVLEDGAGLAIAVDDDGPGMTPDQLAEATTLFGRPSLDAEGTPPGHGIGLTVTAELMAAHGGALSLVSAPGTGTRALLRLPAARVIRLAESGVAAPADATPGGPATTAAGAPAPPDAPVRRPGALDAAE